MPKHPDYFIDPESIEEMARLDMQAHLITQLLGLLPPTVQIPANGKILDIACGPGEWPQEVARQFPTNQVIGTDKSQIMIKYARARTQDLPNVQFLVRDACLPFPYADATFSVIHARLLVGFMTRQTWPTFLKECLRLLEPNGVFIWTESETLLGNSPRMIEYSKLIVNAMYQTGHAFVENQVAMGILLAQETLLREAGFARSQGHLYGLNFSYGTTLHPSITSDLEQAFRLLIPFVTRINAIAEETASVLVQQCIQEMQESSFQALTCCQRVCAYR